MEDEPQFGEPIGFFEDYQPAKFRKSAGRLASIIALLLVLYLIFGCAIPVYLRDRRIDNSIKCADNLREIGAAISRYAANFHDQYPDDFQALLASDEIQASNLVCPASQDQIARGNTTEEILANFSKPGHCSYVYLGKGLTTKTVTPETVIAYDANGEHSDTEMIVLFASGKTEDITDRKPNSILKQVNAGIWPVKYFPTTQATSRP